MVLLGKGSWVLILVMYDVNIGCWIGESVVLGEMVLVWVDVSGKFVLYKVYVCFD